MYKKDKKKKKSIKRRYRVDIVGSGGYRSRRRCIRTCTYAHAAIS